MRRRLTVAETRRRTQERRKALIERLIGVAMSACHHDAEYEGPHAEEGAKHEAEFMRARFALILRGRLLP